MTELLSSSSDVFVFLRACSRAASITVNSPQTAALFRQSIPCPCQPVLGLLPARRRMFAFFVLTWITDAGDDAPSQKRNITRAGASVTAKRR